MDELIIKDVRAVFRVGNSLAISLPPEYVKENKLGPRSQMDVFIVGRSMLIEPIDRVKVVEHIRSLGLEREERSKTLPKNRSNERDDNVTI